MDEDTKYIWWDGKDLADFFAMAGKVGSDNIRVELHRKHEDGPMRLILVEKATDEPCGSYNYSHTCPIDCP